MQSSEQRCITGQGEAEQDTCIFDNLAPGQYVVTPEGLNLSLPLNLFANQLAEVSFDLAVLPPGVTGWQTRVQKNSNAFLGTGRQDSMIRVLLAGQSGQVVALRSARGTEQFCEVVQNPILDALVCEFGGLAAGVYLVEAVNTGAGQRIFLDGQGVAEIVFSPSGTYATQAVNQAPPMVGQGALPDQPTVTATPTQQNVVQPTATRTPSPTPTITLTPTPAFAWQGQIVETVDGVIGTIGVRAAGLKGHPVILRSGDWQSAPQLTGTKPELGDYATEFGGLAQGEYVVELEGLAALKVSLGPDQFMLVEFRYDFVTPP
jgi:hypothetical protein